MNRVHVVISGKNDSDRSIYLSNFLSVCLIKKHFFFMLGKVFFLNPIKAKFNDKLCLME